MMRRLGGALIAAIAVATILPAGPAVATPIPCRERAVQILRGGMRETIRVRTFHIDAKTQAESYKIGTSAKIDVTVTRPAHEDPLDLGVELEPPTSVPAENVIVGLGVHVGDVFIPGFSRTNADGKATVSLKLPGYATPGQASMTVYAWNVVHESPCLRVEEDGFATYPESFEVKR
jgi:hypothetical protein